MPPIVSKLTRWKEGSDQPQCMGITDYGQCPYEAYMASDNCIMHGGNKIQERIERDETRKYRLAILRADYNRHCDDDGIKSLADEIGLARTILQSHLDQCQTSTALLLKSHTISDLLRQIKELVTSCHKLDMSLGGLLDRGKIIAFAEEVVTITTDIFGELDGADDKFGELADRIGEACRNIVLPVDED